jgi:hypothetical protein
MKRIKVPTPAAFQPAPIAPQPRKVPPGVSEPGQPGQVNKNVLKTGPAARPGAK